MENKDVLQFNGQGKRAVALVWSVPRDIKKSLTQPWSRKNDLKDEGEHRHRSGRKSEKLKVKAPFVWSMPGEFLVKWSQVCKECGCSQALKQCLQ